MSSSFEDRSVRVTLWWVRRYTAGLRADLVSARRAEVDSDLAEHQINREADGWEAKKIARERRSRLARGIANDVGWRRDALRPRSERSWHLVVSSLTGLGSILLATFHIMFAAYMLGAISLADKRFLGGLANYADEVGRPIASPIAATIIGSLGLVLVVAALARPISPLVSNLATVGVAMWSVLWFWLGVWPVGLIVIIGSTIDLATRTSETPAQAHP